MLAVVVSCFPAVAVEGVVAPDVDGFGAAVGGGGLVVTGDEAGFAAAGGAAAVLAGGAVVLLDTDAAADDFALFAISNTVEAIEGLPSPPPNNDPLDTCLAALANAPAGLDGTSLLLAPVGVAVVSAFTSSSPSITSGLQFSLLL